MFSFFRKRVQPDFYEHTVWHPPLPDATAAGFVRKFADPPILLTGTGYITRKNLNVTQPPQVYANLAVPNVGFGGVTPNSGMYFTPLANNAVSQVE